MVVVYEVLLLDQSRLIGLSNVFGGSNKY